MTGPVLAQETIATPMPERYIFRMIDNTNGLISNEVYAITQDKKGYMWIGGSKGLQRYDGLRFLNCPSGNPLTVAYLYPDDEHDRVLFYKSDRNLYQWSFRYNRADSTPDDYSLLRTRYGGDTWLVHPTKGLLLERGNQTYSTEFNPIHHPVLEGLSVPSSSIRKALLDCRGNLWLISWSHQFYRYHYPTGKLYKYSIADILRREGMAKTLPGWVSAVFEDDHKKLWFATGMAGLLQYDAYKDKFLYLLHEPDNNLALQYNHNIGGIFQDREENIWLATDKGVCIFNPYRQYFSRYGQRDIGAEIVTAAWTQNKELYVGSWGNGLLIYDTAFRLKKHIFFPGMYEQNMVWSFLQQQDGEIWAGCQHGFLHIIDPLTHSLHTICPPEMERSTIKCMIKDHSGNTLLGLQNGKVVTWDWHQRRFLTCSTSDPALSFTGIESMYVDADGFCWVGTGNGLSGFDTRERTFIGNWRPSSLNSFICRGITAYNDSVLIVGSQDNGLWFFNRHSRMFTRIAVNEEQSSWSANAIAKDSAGNIWFTTDYNVCRYEPATKGFYSCRPEKGLAKGYFSGNTFLTDGNGEPGPANQNLTTGGGKWMTWTHSELVCFDPQEIAAVQNKKTAPSITQFRVFGNPVFVDSFLRTEKPVKLSYRDNFIGIEFSDLQFSGIQRTKYYYRLVGVDKDWVHGGAGGYAGYTNLSPGKYLFRVRTDSANNEKNVTSMAIWIAAPFWATWWFRAIGVLMIILLVVGLVRWYEYGLRKESRMKQQLASTEMMALRAQMNPHFIFNCINSIDALIQSNDKYLATVYLNKFARLLRSILDSSKQHTVTLARDLETLQLYIDLELFRSEHAFTAEIKVDDEILAEDFRVPPLIIQPYVENAIIHGLRNRQGGNGHLLIDVFREEDHLVYRIEDNGVGRDAAGLRSTHRSYGMEMGRDRVNLFNGGENIPVVVTDLRKDGHAVGTKVQVYLKIS
ncbi:histidine kinase [Flavitalea flava]